MPSVAENKTARLARCAALLALASALGLAESIWLPTLPVPGVRIGLANIAVVIALVVLGPSDALIVTLGRVLVVGLATGTLLGPVSVLALVGAAAAWAAMTALRSRGPAFSLIGWSVGGAAASVLAQVAAAAFLASSASVLVLAPLTLALSLPSGLAVGFASRLVISRISRSSLSFVG